MDYQWISGWWFGTFGLFFHILGRIIPTDELIFFRGVGIPPTRYTFWIHWFRAKPFSPGRFWTNIPQELATAFRTSRGGGIADKGWGISLSSGKIKWEYQFCEWRIFVNWMLYYHILSTIWYCKMVGHYQPPGRMGPIFNGQKPPGFLSLPAVGQSYCGLYLVYIPMTYPP